MFQEVLEWEGYKLRKLRNRLQPRAAHAVALLTRWKWTLAHSGHPDFEPSSENMFLASFPISFTQMLKWYFETSDKYFRIVSRSFTATLTFSAHWRQSEVGILPLFRCRNVRYKWEYARLQPLLTVCILVCCNKFLKRSLRRRHT
jgi:hypothetical protein